MNLTDLFEEDDEIGIKDPKAKQALNVARSKYGWATNDLEAFVAMMQDEQVNQDNDIESQFDVNTSQETEIGNNDTDIDSLEQRISQLEQGSVRENAKGFTEDANLAISNNQQTANTKLDKKIKATYKMLMHKIDMTLDKEGVAELEVYLNKLKRLATSKGVELTEEDIDWEPQPEFRGVGGTATSYGDSAKRQRAMKGLPSANRRYNKPQSANTNQLGDKLQGYWTRYIGHIKSANPQQRKDLKPAIIKIVKAAKQHGVSLSPSPAEIGQLLK